MLDIFSKFLLVTLVGARVIVTPADTLGES